MDGAPPRIFTLQYRMPRFAIRPSKPAKRPADISGALVARYERYVRRLEGESIGELKFRESEDIEAARRALRLASEKLSRPIIIRRPRGDGNILELRLKIGEKDVSPGSCQIAPGVRDRTIQVWGLTPTQADDTFGALQSSTDLQCAISDLTAATDLLVRYLKTDRIPVVVRKQIPTRGGVSLVSLLKQGDTKMLLTTCCDMFRFERVQS